MKRNFSILACTGALTIAASGALAESVAQPGFYEGDVAAFHGGGQTLIKALHALHALHAQSGARIVDIRFARQNGVPGFHVVRQKNGQCTFVHVDAQDGRLVTIASETAPDWMLSWNKRAQLKYDRMMSVSLVQAIRTAEAANNGAPAIAAGIARSVSNPEAAVHAYNIILDVAGSTMRVAVDGVTGQIIADPSTLSEWD